MDNPFHDLPILGDLPADVQAQKLREVGETEAADRIVTGGDTEREPGERFAWFDQKERLYLHTTHRFGFIPADAKNPGPITLRDVGNIRPDEVLRDARINITLDRLRVAGYPGTGQHRILFDFYARNQVADRAEDLHFNATYRVAEGEEAGVRGYPIFVGLNVGSYGVAFRGYTVNVRNENDQSILDILESDAFKTGLKLVNAVQPAIVPLSQMALGLTKAIVGRHKNVPVQDFFLGLDSGSSPMGARLAEGSYVIVQLPQEEADAWRWDHWEYDCSTGRIAKTSDANASLRYNYLVLGVARY
jgi:hypothetical protein